MPALTTIVGRHQTVAHDGATSFASASASSNCQWMSRPAKRSLSLRSCIDEINCRADVRHWTTRRLPFAAAAIITRLFCIRPEPPLIDDRRRMSIDAGCVPRRTISVSAPGAAAPDRPFISADRRIARGFRRAWMAIRPSRRAAPRTLPASGLPKRCAVFSDHISGCRQQACRPAGWPTRATPMKPTSH